MLWPKIIELNSKDGRNQNLLVTKVSSGLTSHKES